MSARPDTWMPMYWGDYARDTGHLNACGHGAYLMLIKHYWCVGKALPNDDNELWRIACCDSKKEWMKLRPKIIRLFVQDGGFLRHKRVDREILAAASHVTAKAEAGKKGAFRRWQKDGTSMRVPSSSHRQTDAPSPSQKKEGSEAKASGADAPKSTDVRSWLFQEGLAIVRAQTGKPDGSARGMIGGWLKAARDDAGLVAAKLGAANDLRPANLASWMSAALSVSNRVDDAWDAVMTPANLFDLESTADDITSYR